MHFSEGKLSPQENLKKITRPEIKVKVLLLIASAIEGILKDYFRFSCS